MSCINTCNVKLKVIIFTFILIQNSCINKSSKQLSTASFQPPLDTNDVSILFPPAASNGLLMPLLEDGVQKMIPADNGFGNKLFPGPPSETAQAAATVMSQRLEALVQKGFWPALVQSDLNPKGLLPRQIFEEIIDFASRKSARFPFPVGVNYGLPTFDGERIDMADQRRWRIVSLRFTPCPDLTAHEFKIKERAGQSASVKNLRCEPEMRVVAQPIVGENLEEMRTGAVMPKMGLLQSSVRALRENQKALAQLESPQSQNTLEKDARELQMSMLKLSIKQTLDGMRTVDEAIQARQVGGWVFADYGIHVFFSLKSEDAEVFVKKLSSLKSRFDGDCPTSGRPLSVHPCFLKEIENVTGAQGFAREVSVILGEAPLTIKKIAVMGTAENENPWSFFVGEVKGNRFEPIAVPGVMAMDVSKELRASQKPIVNKFAMSVSRASSIAGVISTSGDTSKSRYNPRPHPRFDSLDLIARGQTNQIEANEFMKIVKREQSDRGLPEGTRLEGLPGLANVNQKYLDVFEISGVAATLGSRIANPKINSEFMVDCASCHMVNSDPTIRAHVSPLKVNRAMLYAGLEPTADFYFEEINNKRNEFLLNAPYAENIYTAPQGVTPGRLRSHHLPFLSSISVAASSGSFPKIEEIGSGISVYVFNQFSIYKNWPIVSQRVANESSEAAHHANEKWFDGRMPVEKKIDPKLWMVCENSGTEMPWYQFIDADDCLKRLPEF